MGVSEHPLPLPELLATGKGGIEAFVENDGENELRKHRHATGHLYWVYARLDLKDMPITQQGGTRYLLKQGKKGLMGEERSSVLRL